MHLHLHLHSLTLHSSTVSLIHNLLTTGLSLELSNYIHFLGELIHFLHFKNLNMPTPRFTAPALTSLPNLTIIPQTLMYQYQR